MVEVKKLSNYLFCKKTIAMARPTKQTPKNTDEKKRNFSKPLFV